MDLNFTITEITYNCEMLTALLPLLLASPSLGLDWGWGWGTTARPKHYSQQQDYYYDYEETHHHAYHGRSDY